VDSVTVSELRQQTARVLDRVRAGETLEICEYGRPVARLLPTGPRTGSSLLDRLIAQGRAVPAAIPGPVPPTPPREVGEEPASPSMTFAEIRADERY
jgi:prevent-host-death family protein